MHFSLVVVGAHDGSKTDGLIRHGAGMGKVLLLEPVPFLFKKLGARFTNVPNIVLRNAAIATQDGEVDFVAPKETAKSVAVFGDQLGSLVPGHAVAHDTRMSVHTEIIRIPALSFAALVEAEEISSIDLLITDAEGMDAEVLPTFPFSKVVPKRIIFEFKHSDGYQRVGRKLASLLVLLEDHGYIVTVVDGENLSATHQSVPTARQNWRPGSAR